MSSPGETVSVGGPSGSGKTTLFRVLAGLWPLGEGEVGTPEGRRVLFLPQRPYLPIGTLREVLSYPERARGSTMAPAAKALKRACSATCPAARRERQLVAGAVGRRAAAARLRARAASPAELALHRRRHVGARHEDGGAALRAAEGALARRRDRQHRASAGGGRLSTTGTSTSTRSVTSLIEGTAGDKRSHPPEPGHHEIARNGVDGGSRARGNGP